MYHAPQPYARKLRQLSYTLKRINSRKACGNSVPRKLLANAKALFNELRYGLNGPRVAKILQAASLVLGLTTQAQAQVPMYLPPTANPFGLEGLTQFGVAVKKASFGDIDGDGDLDMLFSLSSDNNFQTLLAFSTNLGSPEEPFFIAPAFNLYGIADLADIFSYKSDFVDLDGDGDLDIITCGIDSSINTKVVFFENVGTANSPSFAPPQFNPFGFGDNQEFLYLPAYGDLDNDGDLDILTQAFGAGAFTFPFFHYYENVSTSNTTSFQGPSVQPFNLGAPGFYGYNYLMELVDIDEDGDLDITAHVEFDGVNPGDPDIRTFGSFENFGNANSPAFLPPDTLQFEILAPEEVAYLLTFAMADLDNDGDLDIVSSHEYDVTLYYENVQITATEEVIDERLFISLSPNPTKGIMRISSEFPLKVIEVIDASGQSIEKIDGSNTEVDLSKYPDGIYLLEITTEDKRMITRKVQKI